MNRLEKALEAMNVNISRYVVSNEDGKMTLNTIGGIEIVNSYDIKDFKAINGSYDKIDIHGSGNEKVLLPFMYTDTRMDVEHIEKLVTQRKIKTISKEQALEYEIVNKDKLLNKIVYVYEATPSTNSIALAEQFDIRHDNVVQQIFKLAEFNPSVLMGIKYGVYEYESSIPNNKKNPDIKDSVRVTEDSVTRLNPTVIKYDTFLHISEDVYYRFINSMGTPKSLEMKVYRDTKRQEYLKGFQILRERVLLSGVKERELEDMLKVRTEKTKELMVSIKDYVTHYNNNSGANKQLDFNSVCRLIFNVINDKVGIDAKDYPNKRQDRSNGGDIQRLLRDEEVRLTMALELSKIHNIDLAGAIKASLRVTFRDIEDYLNNKNVGELLAMLN